MPVRYSAMNKTTGTGPSSMMAAIMVTAATCNQNEKIEKQTTIYPSEDVNKLKVLSAGNFTCKANKKHTAFSLLISFGRFFCSPSFRRRFYFDFFQLRFFFSLALSQSLSEHELAPLLSLVGSWCSVRNSGVRFFFVFATFYCFISIQRKTICYIIWFNLGMSVAAADATPAFYGKKEPYFSCSECECDQNARITFLAEIELWFRLFFLTSCLLLLTRFP